MSGTLAAFTLFALVAGFTPGPNNVMVAASGANFGYRRSQPHLAGVVIGFPLLLLGVGFGLSEIFLRLPILHEALKLAGSAYLLFLAWKIATAAGIGDAKGSARPLSFLQALLFQWVNPKGWITVLASVTAFTEPNASFHLQLFVLAGISLLVTLCSIHSWCLFGVSVGGLLARKPGYLRSFNLVMGLLLVAAVVHVWI